MNIKKCQVFVEGMQIEKANGQKSKVPLRPSNLMITSLNLSDKRRKEMLEPTKPKKASEGGVKNE